MIYRHLLPGKVYRLTEPYNLITYYYGRNSVFRKLFPNPERTDNGYITLPLPVGATFKVGAYSSSSTLASVSLLFSKHRNKAWFLKNTGNALLYLSLPHMVDMQADEVVDPLEPARLPWTQEKSTETTNGMDYVSELKNEPSNTI